MKYSRLRDAIISRGNNQPTVRKPRTALLNMVRDREQSYNAVDAIRKIINKNNEKIRQCIPNRKVEYFRKIIEHVISEFQVNRWDFVPSADQEAKVIVRKVRNPKTNKLETVKSVQRWPSKRISFPANPNSVDTKPND